jgi:hypothetical protein
MSMSPAARRAKEAALTNSDIHRTFAALINAEEDPAVQNAMLAALRYPVAERVIEHLSALMAKDKDTEELT